MFDRADMGDSPTPDQLDALADEIATFAARVDVAKHALLTRLRLFDSYDGWASYSKVRAITRVATPATEQDLIDIGIHATASQLERLSRSYRRVVDSADGAGKSDAQLKRSRRYLRHSETAGGMTKIEIQLPAEEAGVVWNAVMSAADASAGASSMSVAAAA